MNQKLTLNPDASDDVAVPSDDAVRQALLRMGSGKPKTGNNNGGGQHHGGGGHHNNGGQRRGGEQMQAASASPDARRRRFSQNENVPVEYVSRDRQGGRHEPMRMEAGRADAGEPADDRAGFLERELDRERSARQAVERSLEETRAALTAARTRIAHLEIDIGEVRAQRQAMLDLAQSAAAQQTTEAQARTAATEGSGELDDPSAARRGRGRPRRVLSEATEDAEPEPVKWWNDD